MSTEKPLTSATETSRPPGRRSCRSRWVALSLKRKILLIVLAWGMIETIVNWIFKANGIEVGPSSLPPILSIILGGW